MKPISPDKSADIWRTALLAGVTFLGVGSLIGHANASERDHYATLPPDAVAMDIGHTVMTNSQMAKEYDIEAGAGEILAVTGLGVFAVAFLVNPPSRRL